MDTEIFGLKYHLEKLGSKQSLITGRELKSVKIYTIIRTIYTKSVQLIFSSIESKYI